jgi:S1-C subfamily serine protease
VHRIAFFLAVALNSALADWTLAQPPAASTPNTPADDLTPDERIAVNVYASVNRSVVHITTRAAAAETMFGLVEPPAGTGSGSVINKRGHILTNNHVVENAKRIEVQLADGSSHEAKLVGTDPNNDLAVLQISTSADRLIPIAWGESSRLLVGMRVYAIGNPFGLERTLTTGIVSSLNRSLRTGNNRMIRGIIQTDAAINPGNSGGPLLDKHGQLIGITTAIISRSGASAGVGLAIPSSVAWRVADELIRNGKIVRPELGVFSVLETDKGLLVNRLTPDGPAAKAGVRGPLEQDVQHGSMTYHMTDRSKADLIVAVDGRKTRTLDEMLSYVESKKAGDTVTLKVIRDRKEVEVPVTLAGPIQAKE